MVKRNLSVIEHRTPPYAPYRSWKSLIDKLKGERPLPKRLDSSFWNRLKFSGAMISVLKPAMVSLELLTRDMEPTTLLGELLDASGDKEPIVYSLLMEICYPNYASHLDLDSMTDGELTQYFASIGASGETGQKARTFFLGLAKDARKTLSGRVTTRTRRAASQSRQGNTKRKKAQPDGRGMEAFLGKRAGAPVERDTASAQGSLMLWGLFKRLPEPGSVFPTREREVWLEAAKALFMVEYSETASTPSLPERGAPPG